MGDHPRDWTERHTDGRRWLGGEKLRWLHRPYVSCNFNSPAGISMPLRSWRALTQEPSGFCDQTIPAYDDAIHALQNELPDRKRVVEPGARPAHAARHFASPHTTFRSAHHPPAFHPSSLPRSVPSKGISSHLE